MSIEWVTLLLLFAVFAIFATGLPIGFSLGSIGMVFALFLWGPESMELAAHSALGTMTSFTLVAIPLFVLMGNILERSGIAERLFRMMYLWMGPLRGGLAIGTVFICTAMGAMVGVIGAGIVTMGILALPSMLKRGYDKHMSMGAIMAGGSLGALIPPSVGMVIYCSLARISIGQMFLAGFIPGFILSGLYMLYIGIKCYFNPSAGPALPPEERVTWREKFLVLRDVVIPIFLIVIVLGSIFFGIATPTEASGVGAFGAFLITVLYGKFSWVMLKEAFYRTTKVTSMVVWILIGASCFDRFYLSMGAGELIQNLIIGYNVDPWFILIGMMLSLLILGTILDDYAILMITAPIYVPIITSLGFDPLWFGILFIMNMQIAVLTPPYGFALFYMKGVSPEINMVQLYRAVVPFLGLQVIGLVIIMVFPSLVLWLPGLFLQ
jgi:tripartite ATP-independent transporter DctM subunit